jgi:hypothetical protein
LHADADGTIAHVRSSSFRDGVIIDVDDAIEVERDNLGDGMKFVEVVLAISNEGG